MDWLKAIAGAIGLADFWSKWFGRQQDQKTGAAVNQGKNDAKSLQTLSEVTRPIGVDESDRLWDSNKAKFDPDHRPTH